MSIYALGDLHLSLASPKPMDIFGEHWRDHDIRIAENWDFLVKPDDIVLVAGDVSWALKPEQAMIDIDWIARRPGKKILIRGNHDFWWHRESTNRLQREIPDNIMLLQGHSILIDGITFAGTRGWRLEDGVVESEKIMRRELGYLERALKESSDSDHRIVLLHYPPFDQDLTPNAFDDMIRQYGADQVVYGHIHGGETVEGDINGITYTCVSADHIGFRPVLIYK